MATTYSARGASRSRSRRSPPGVALKGTVDALGFNAVAEELVVKLRAPRVRIDSTAAKGAAMRLGLRKLKHVELKFLWVQEAVRERRV